MTEAVQNKVFLTLKEYYSAHPSAAMPCPRRIVHCVNPFDAPPDSEHDRAQRITFKSLNDARAISQLLSPELEVRLVKVTDHQDVPSSLIQFDDHFTVTRAVTDLANFRIPKALPIMMDILSAVPVEADDILVFTNIDIAPVPGFYGFLQEIFSRGTDCAIINRRTISDIYESASDLPLMSCEVGALHPGFDCFAFRGRLRDMLIPYDSCVGIGGVMLPLLHQLLAIAERPVVLLDAHATFHIGDDRQWRNDDFADYTAHNQSEIDRIFRQLITDPAASARLISRLSEAHEGWVFPKRLRSLSSPTQKSRQRQASNLMGQIRSLSERYLGR